MDSEDAATRNITEMRSVTVRSRSLHDVREFYEALGIAVVARDGVLDDDYLEMDLGGVTMIVRPGTAFQPAQACMDIVVAVDEPGRRIAAALSVLLPRGRIHASTAGNVVLTDPDGRSIRLVPDRKATTTHDR